MNLRPFTSRTPERLACCALLLATLAGCAHEPSDLESAMGESVRQARMQQAVAPADGVFGRTPVGADGVIAVHGIDRYHQTWIRPPAPLTVLNIQAGNPVQGGQSALPR